MKKLLSLAALNAYRPVRLNRADLESSAVLIPVIREVRGDRMIFTVRSNRLRFQPGHISFPGGKVEPHETDLAACALREAEEEISLRRDNVEIAGELDQVIVSGRYLVSPFVGLLRGGELFKPAEPEIEAVIAIDLADFLDPRKLETVPGMRGSSGKPVYKFTVGEFTIWGATARILKQFLEIGFGIDYAMETGVGGQGSE